jgi:hypothetical protein
MKHWVNRDVTVPAGGVLKQMTDRDVAEARILRAAFWEVGLVWEEFEHWLIEGEHALIHQPQHSHRGDRLGNAGDAKECVWLDRLLSLAIGVAEATGIDNAALLGDCQGRSWNLVLLQK